MTTVTREPVRSVDDAFLDVVLADPELVDAEFEALVSATWSTAPPAGTPPVPSPAPSGRPPSGGFRDVRPGRGSRRYAAPQPGIDGRRRERSPPP